LPSTRCCCLDADCGFIAVSVIDGTFSIYLPHRDQERNVTTMEVLVDWLDANESQLLGN